MAVIYQTTVLGEAKFQVWVASMPGEADLWVYATENLFLSHGDWFWYITKNRGIATSLLYFGDRGKADFSVYFVPDRNLAGWQFPRPRIQGKL